MNKMRERRTSALEKEVSGEVGVWLHDRAGSPRWN